MKTFTKALVVLSLILAPFSATLAYSRGGSFGGGSFKGSSSFSGGYSRSIPTPSFKPAPSVSPGYSRSVPLPKASASVGAGTEYTRPSSTYHPTLAYVPPTHVYVSSGGSSMGTNFWFWMWLTGRQNQVYSTPQPVPPGHNYVVASASSTISASSTLIAVPCTKHHWIVFWKPKCKA